MLGIFSLYIALSLPLNFLVMSPINLSVLIFPLFLAFGSWRLWAYIIAWEATSGAVYFVYLADVWGKIGSMQFPQVVDAMDRIPRGPTVPPAYYPLVAWVFAVELSIFAYFVFRFWRSYLRAVRQIKQRVGLRFVKT